MEHPDCAIDVICEIGARMRQTNLLVSQRVTRNINVEMEEKATLVNVWRIGLLLSVVRDLYYYYVSFLVAWMGFNSFVLLHYGRGENGAQFDPYPYILLNLMLSMTAALQAPIIMMSQNRAAEKDRLAAEQDFKVNLKSELMLEELMRKSQAREGQIDELLESVKLLHRERNTSRQ